MTDTRRIDAIEFENELAAIVGGSDAARVGDIFERLAHPASLSLRGLTADRVSALREN